MIKIVLCIHEIRRILDEILVHVASFLAAHIMTPVLKVAIRSFEN